MGTDFYQNPPKTMEDDAPNIWLRKFCESKGYTLTGDTITTTINTGLCTIQNVEEKIINPCIKKAKAFRVVFNGIDCIGTPDFKGERLVRFYFLPQEAQNE